MTKPTHHIFVCGSFRATGAQGVCHKKESAQLLQYFEQEAGDRGLDGVMVSSTGCLKACDNGPIVIVYPQNVWYKRSTRKSPMPSSTRLKATPWRKSTCWPEAQSSAGAPTPLASHGIAPICRPSNHHGKDVHETSGHAPAHRHHPARR